MAWIARLAIAVGTAFLVVAAAWLIAVALPFSETPTVKQADTLKKVRNELRGEVVPERLRTFIHWSADNLEECWARLERYAAELAACRETLKGPQP